MVIQEIKNIDGKDYKYTYSDSGKELRQVETGFIFTDALDKLNSSFSYEEVENELSISEDITNEMM